MFENVVLGAASKQERAMNREIASRACESLGISESTFEQIPSRYTAS